MADNTVTVIGNVTRDPELRFTPSGQAIATFGLAVNRRWQNRQTQEWEEQVSFFDITCWAQLGQNVADTLVKGSRAIVTGRLEQRSWETDQGDKRSKVEIIADEVGPSLRWATADITRNERREGGDAPAGGGGGASRPIANPAPAGYDPAEEPF
jgi:single-strand DNA-binding protein